MWEMTNVKEHRKSLKTASAMQILLHENDAQSQKQLADPPKVTRDTVPIYLKAMGKMQKLEWNGFDMNWMKDHKKIGNAARHVQKKVISSSNCERCWKVYFKKLCVWWVHKSVIYYELVKIYTKIPVYLHTWYITLFLLKILGSEE